MSGAPSSSKKIEHIDPLLQDLNEKKQNFRRNVVSLAAELKDARSRLASKEESLACETRFRQVIIPIFFFFQISYHLFFLPLSKDPSFSGRGKRMGLFSFVTIVQVAETKAKGMEDEVCRLRERLQEKDGQIEATHSAAEQVITCSHLLVACSRCEVGICLYLSLKKKKKPSGMLVTSPGCVRVFFFYRFLSHANDRLLFLCYLASRDSHFCVYHLTQSRSTSFYCLKFSFFAISNFTAPGRLSPPSPILF